MDGNDFAKGMLIGAVAGAIGGILFAPEKGEDTRADIKGKFDEIKDKVSKELKKADEFTKDIYDNAVKRVIASYEEAKEITPEDAQEINKIFEKSFAEVEKVIARDVKKIKKAGK